MSRWWSLLRPPGQPGCSSHLSSSARARAGRRGQTCAPTAAGGFRSDIACPRTDRDRNGPSTACADIHNRAGSLEPLKGKLKGSDDLVWMVRFRRLLERSRDQADFLELGCDDIPVEWLHDVFVGAG